MISRLVAAIILFSFAGVARSGERNIHVFVALCDNATQGIIKVNPRIGDGNSLDNNLYWGCSDGMRSYFKQSSKWKLVKSEKDLSPAIMERLTFQHTSFQDVTLIADAYRGSEMKLCLKDFMKAAGDGDHKETGMVAFIGHNGLMDHPSLPTPAGNGQREAIVLSCLSDSWFSNRLEEMAVKPLLMTKSLMYPGAFILHDALEGWLRKETKAQVRERAAKAYARNQKISVKGGRSIFSE